MLTSERFDLHGLVNYLKHAVRAQMSEDANSEPEQVTSHDIICQEHWQQSFIGTNAYVNGFFHSYNY